ncbi:MULTISPECIES: hypothetical protein [unclassified Mesorhizobium]|uniref:hypothetical protein n=1 Tax=unclassified Mesorhizobium TaxID=325217 RepID=UPI0003CF09BF|nr:MULTISPECIES: hypothetical protein [unclassified Mesorhizobium]ESX29465.1 hypothetical protein X765_14235 [Mesorhizobium sp. LSHC440B00]ESX37764.1 hypothetical protein X763_12700 [Mesorhizobium sp. LSHC432A00]ESX43275.1 hypothetical protein X764_08020 [Mesorhizobium sp. LSHC440A00]ESY48073.1 hypothetical protein X746_11345 [Mesorhizobium sp. LNJC380A00]WJI57397.1 hypothetical protein NLY33_01150 [Mesorhizobium sp. C432A]
MSYEDLSLEQLGAQAYGHYQAGEKNNKRANDHAKSCGLYLIEAKSRVAKRKDITWPQFLKAHCDIGRSRADEIIMIIEGRTEPTAPANRVREWREKQAEVRRTYGKSSKIPQQKQQTSRCAADRERAEVEARIDTILKGFTTNQLKDLEVRLRNVSRAGGCLAIWTAAAA